MRSALGVGPYIYNMSALILYLYEHFDYEQTGTCFDNVFSFNLLGGFYFELRLWSCSCCNIWDYKVSYGMKSLHSDDEENKTFMREEEDKIVAAINTLKC